jgi:perosamine synthetase
MSAFIPQMEPWFGEEEKKAVLKYMNEGGWITEFKQTAKFENMIAEYTRARHSVVVNNGTVSLTLAALACGIQAGDEIIVPNYTMIATPNSIKMLGANPVFVDVEPETLCLDIYKVENAITKKTKAVMLVSANGRYPKAGIQAFSDLCDRRSLILMEDAAQSLGSFFPNSRHIGTAGLIGSFSFSAPKVISTGQGGCIVTNDDEIGYKLRRLKDFGRSEGGTDIHDSIGYNFKFTDLQACIGIEQIRKLPWRVERKKEIYRVYQQSLRDLKQVSFFDQDLSVTTPWFIDVLVSDRERLREFLTSRGVGTRPMYPPINKQKCYQVSGEHKVSEMVGQKGLWLPSSSKLTDEQIVYVCDRITEFYQ